MRTDRGARWVAHISASLCVQIFAADFRRLFNNCRHYNTPDTPYFKCANRLEAFFEAKVAGSITWSKRANII